MIATERNTGSTICQTMQIVWLLLLFGLPTIASASTEGVENSIPASRDDARFHPVTGKNGMVVSQEGWATRAGLEVLKNGGNAVDAAVTVGFALAVTLPRAGNIGGGGFMLVHLSEDNNTVALDYREMAPHRAHRDMFLNSKGEVDPERSRYSYLSVGVPGTVRGLALALKKFGTITLKEALTPAIRLAEDGFPVSEDLHRSLILAKSRMQDSPAAMRIFFKSDGSPYEVGEILRQSDLANSLNVIAEEGPDAFYEGEIAQRIVADMNANGGLIDAVDLKEYHPVIRQPIRGTYHRYEILSMPPPSSGGVHLIQLLNLLEPSALRELGHNSAAYIHLLTECMKLAYADRSKHLGDSDFVSVPVEQLISKEYASHLRQFISLESPTTSADIKPGNPSQFRESIETTHFSIVDRWGNAVANTYTLNFSYGCKKVVPGTGILLNNQMDDFSAKPGIANAYGLIGGEANAIEPGKRMLSSMTPTIVLQAGEPYLVTGSPGGSRIITTVLQLLLNVIDHRMNIAEASNAFRFHHQWYPDQLLFESSLSPDTRTLLQDYGYAPILSNAIGSTQSILRSHNYLYGHSDPRRQGGLAAGF